MASEWERHTAGEITPPSIRDILEFFRLRQLSMIAKPVKSSFQAKSQPYVKKLSASSTSSMPVRTVHNVTEERFKCPACNVSTHPVARCFKFLELSPEQRQVVKEARLCFNCLGPDHALWNCRSSQVCRKCKLRHHTLLHKQASPVTVDAIEPEVETKALHATSLTLSLLATAVATAINGGIRQKVRALLDNGAALSLVTERLASALQLERHPEELQIRGLSETRRSKHYVNINLGSFHAPASQDRVIVKCQVTWELWKKYSSFDCLISIVAWLRCFTHNTHQTKERQELAKTLTAEELAELRLKLLILSQQESYPELFFEGHADLSKTIPSCLARFNVSVD